MDEEKSRKLEDFKDCTGLEDQGACLAYLEATEWNLLIAVQNYGRLKADDEMIDYNLAAYQGETDIQDLSICKQHLKDTNWNLEEAIYKYQTNMRELEVNGQILDKYQATTGIGDVDICRRNLELTNWNLEDALKAHRNQMENESGNRRIALLQEFQKCTGIADVGKCQTYMEASNWNCQEAIQSAFKDLRQSIPVNNDQNNGNNRPAQGDLQPGKKQFAVVFNDYYRPYVPNRKEEENYLRTGEPDSYTPEFESLPEPVRETEQIHDIFQRQDTRFSHMDTFHTSTLPNARHFKRDNTTTEKTLHRSQSFSRHETIEREAKYHTNPGQTFYPNEPPFKEMLGFQPNFSNASPTAPPMPVPSRNTPEAEEAPLRDVRLERISARAREQAATVQQRKSFTALPLNHNTSNKHLFRSVDEKLAHPNLINRQRYTGVKLKDTNPLIQPAKSNLIQGENSDKGLDFTRASDAFRAPTAISHGAQAGPPRPSGADAFRRSFHRAQSTSDKIPTIPKLLDQTRRLFPEEQNNPNIKPNFIRKEPFKIDTQAVREQPTISRVAQNDFRRVFDEPVRRSILKPTRTNNTVPTMPKQFEENKRFIADTQNITNVKQFFIQKEPLILHEPQVRQGDVKINPAHGIQQDRRYSYHKSTTKDDRSYRNKPADQPSAARNIRQEVCKLPSMKTEGSHISSRMNQPDLSLTSLTQRKSDGGYKYERFKNSLIPTFPDNCVEIRVVGKHKTFTEAITSRKFFTNERELNDCIQQLNSFMTTFNEEDTDINNFQNKSTERGREESPEPIRTAHRTREERTTEVPKADSLPVQETRENPKAQETPQSPNDKPLETDETPKESDINYTFPDDSVTEEPMTFAERFSCAICYEENNFDYMVQCADGHLFCIQCLTNWAEQSVYGQGKNTLQCLDSECEAVFPESQLVRALPVKLKKAFDKRIQEDNLNISDLRNFIRCPSCNYGAEIDDEEQYFACPNLECQKSSCRTCRKDWFKHKGLRCNEVEEEKETAIRTTYEEKMAEARIRQCSKCKARFTKESGCNKITCSCETTMCYICRAPNIDYAHFCNHLWEPGHGCATCQRCSLYTDPAHDEELAIQELKNNAAEARAQEGFNEVREIGAPAQ